MLRYLPHVALLLLVEHVQFQRFLGQLGREQVPGTLSVNQHFAAVKLLSFLVQLLLH